MSSITLRSASSTPLTHSHVDANFTNLNNDKAGYVAGEGDTQTQAADSKANTVTMTSTKKCGKIIMDDAQLNANTTVVFQVTSDAVAATDVIVVNHSSVGTAGDYLVWICAVSAGLFKIAVRNMTSANKSEAIVLSYAIVKAVAT